MQKVVRKWSCSLCCTEEVEQNWRADLERLNPRHCPWLTRKRWRKAQGMA
jgi:hypothetical protein